MVGADDRVVVDNAATWLGGVIFTSRGAAASLMAVRTHSSGGQGVAFGVYGGNGSIVLIDPYAMLSLSIGECDFIITPVIDDFSLFTGGGSLFGRHLQNHCTYAYVVNRMIFVLYQRDPHGHRHWPWS